MVGDQINNQVNSVKLSNSINSMKDRDMQMAMILKLGAGGDAQNHVTTPMSIKEREFDSEPIRKNSF